MRIAAVRTLGIGVALYALGALAHSARYLAGDIEPDQLALWAIAALIAFVAAYGATLLLRRPHVFARALVVVVIALLIVPAISQSWDGSPRALTLTRRENEAFRYLLEADTFEMPHVGFAAVYSGGYLAMRLLSRSPSASLAFEELVRRGTPAGQLYGLCGLRRFDPIAFQIAKPRFASDAEIPVFNGCVIGAERVSSIVVAEHAVQLRPHETLEHWWQGHGGEEIVLDIDGGAYSSIFFDRDFDEAAAFAAEREYDFSR